MSAALNRPDSRAFAELLQVMKDAEQEFLQGRQLEDDVEFADAYQHLLAVIGGGIEFFVQNDPRHPHLARIVSPHRKLGGDNAHAFYDLAPLDGQTRYRIRGNPGEACYLGFTAYGGNEEQMHIIGNLSLTEMGADPAGDFELSLGPEPAGSRRNHIQLAADASNLVIRQYYHRPDQDRHARLSIEAVDSGLPRGWLDGDEMARRLGCLTRFVRGWARLSPMAMPPGPEAYNQVCDPFHASQSTGHWSTPDNHHAFGFFRLEEDQALLLHGSSPPCTYWSCHLWNTSMQTFDYSHYPVAVSDHDVVLEPDGSWKLVISHQDPGRPNWLNTTGYRRGFIYFRWLHPQTLPPPMHSRLLKLSELASG